MRDNSFENAINLEEQLWFSILEDSMIKDASLLSCSESSVHRRVYEGDGCVYKIVLTHEKIYENTLKREYEILAKLQDKPFIPQIVSFAEKKEYSILALEKYHGEYIGQFGDFVSNNIVSVVSLLVYVFQLNKLGVRHGDIQRNNLIFLPDGQIVIIDFDQAINTNFLNSFLGDFFAIGKYPAKRTVTRFSLHVLFSRLPFMLRKPLKKLKEIIFNNGFRKRGSLPIVQGDDELSNIWKMAGSSDANAPGGAVNYYSLRYKKQLYAGERAWEPRWSKINQAVSFEGKSLLELGCNLSLLSCYAQKFGGAVGGLAIDHDADILKAAKAMSAFIGLDLRHDQVDFDSESDWERGLVSGGYDIVSALSVLNWLDNKKRFLEFLSGFNEIIFEGHDSITVEYSRLKSMGFRSIALVDVSERGRVVLYGKK